MALKSVAVTTAKWLANYQGASQAMTDGANAVTVAPGQLAAAQVQKWITKLQASQNKWVERVGNVTLAEWKQSYISLGIQRGQAGAASKQANFTNFYTQYYAFLNSVLPQIQQMPTTNLQQSIAKMTAMVTASATQFNYTGK